jgi:pantoate--beta-alanine ligase
MLLVDSKAAVRRAVADAKRSGARVALVPTMGYLHAGHLALVERARAEADWVAMSVFVNPLQFGPSEDLARYPRDLERDAALAREHGVDLLFAPAVAEMYPEGEPWIAVVPEQGSDLLCGASRPGHFRGVLTVVAKLLGVFTPDVAVFGQKDFQQAALIRRMCEDLDMPVRIVVAPTVREEDGLALSSRNVYLSAEDRTQARALSGALAQCLTLFEAGETNADMYRFTLHSALKAEGVQAEYAEVVDPRTLQPVRNVQSGTVCAVAARVGTTRLIDNVILEPQSALRSGTLPHAAGEARTETFSRDSVVEPTALSISTP